MQNLQERDNKKYVIGVGAANVDLHGRSRSPLVMRDSNPGRLHTSAGGVTRNVLENLARQGLCVSLVSAVGDDLFGRYILSESEAAGVDVSLVRRVEGARSSCYLAVLDERGDMLLGMSDMSILRHVSPDYLASLRERLRGAAALVCDPCLPRETLRFLSEELLPGGPLFLDPVSTAYARKAEPIIGNFYCVKPNRMELAVLSSRDTETDEGVRRGAEELLRRGLRLVVVSLGERGCYYADAGGRSGFLSLSPAENMVNATGAGDAFMSGLVHGFVAGFSVEDAVYYALGAGRLAVLSDETINPKMSHSAVLAAVSEYKL